MIVELTSGFTPRPLYDACIVGAGAAGITLARALRRKGFSVLLAEGGERGFSAHSQDCYQGTVAGDPYFPLDTARLRFLGGTTNHWGGWCRTLDPHDFMPKAASPLAHWPVRAEELAPYAAEAARILDIEAQPADRPLAGSETLSQIFFTESLPITRIADKYAAELERDQDLHLCVCANFVGFDLQDGTVAAVRLRNYGGIERRVAARSVVLACGSIENARLLLHENRRFNDQLGNQGSCVGRYWMEHPTFTLGGFMLFPHRLAEAEFDPEALDMDSPVSRRWFVAPTMRFMQRRRILNCGIRLEPVERTRTRQYLADLICASPNLLHPMLARLGREVRCAGEIRAAWEQEPLAENRVTLGPGSDRFGIPRVALHWRKSALDRRTARETALEVARHLAERDIGRIRLDSWLLDDARDWPDHDELAGYHHMGGTRMATTPQDGVADPNGRIFGTRNLYAAGSGLFPAGGHANPTLSIVQLALRLGDHLEREMAAPAVRISPGASH